MGVDEPGAEDRLGQDIKNGIGDDLSIDRGDSGTVSDTPDAVVC